MSVRVNTAWNLAGTGLPLLAGVAFIPYTIERLGGAAFGVVALLWALIGYFGLFDMGVGRALTFRISKLLAAGEEQNVSAALKAGLLVTAVTGVLGGGLLWFLAHPLAFSWLKLDSDLQSDAEHAFQICALGVLPTTVTSGLRGALEGFGRFGESNVIRLFFGLCMFSLPALSIFLHGNHVSMIALYLVVARLVVLMMGLVQLRGALSRESPIASMRTEIGSLFTFGFWVTVSGIVGPLMVYGDRFFVATVVGAEQLQFYAIPQEGLQRLLIIPGALAGALLPVFSSLKGPALNAVYRLNQRRIAIGMLIICAGSAVLAYPALALWLSPDFAKTALPIVMILAAGIWVNSIAQLPYTLLHAAGNPRQTALFHLVELIFYFLILYILASNFGLVGAAFAWVMRVALDFLLLRFATERFLRDDESVARI